MDLDDLDLDDLISDLEEPAPKSGRKQQDLESTAAILFCMTLVRHSEPGEQEQEQDDDSSLAAALAPVAAQFWLTLAQATAAVARTSRSNPETSRAALDQTHNWLAKAIRRAPLDAHVLHAAGRVLYRLQELEVVEEEERKEMLERACLSLADAAELAPGRADLLNDLGTFLGTRAGITEGPEGTELLREAGRRYDEAARCFNATNRRFSRTGHLHPEYTRAVSCAGAIRCALADAISDEEEKGKLLRRGYRQLCEVTEDTGSEPLQRLLMGQMTLALAELPGDREARRKLFGEACDHFAAAGEAAPDCLADTYAQWGRAMVGCAAFSSGAGRRELIERADELFEEAARCAEGSSEPALAAANAWLLMAAESVAEEEQHAARRAAEAARRANRVEPGSGDYELACAFSRLRQPDDAAEALAAALARDPEAGSHALNDPDLEALWEAKPELRSTIAARQNP